jgi:negative regulator of replication initiation
MSQQQEIQSKYKELKSLLADETLTDAQKEEIHEQMQKLSDLYSYNKSTLAALSTDISGEKEIHVNKNIDTDKS